PILNIGYKRSLTDDDLFDLSPNDECRLLLKRFETKWEKWENEHGGYANTWKIVSLTFSKEFLITGLMFLPSVAIRIAQPLLLKEIVLNISNPNAPTYVGYLYAVGLGLAVMLQSFIHQQLGFRTTRIGTQIRIAITSTIYKRVLNLRENAFMKTTTGQIVNLIANDASKFEELGLYIHYLWEAPLEACI
ncbi:unnamed protein product, partial [Didymodactylos carnosus]